MVELYKVIEENGKLNYHFIPTSLFCGRLLIRGYSWLSPNEWAITKQACRDEMVVQFAVVFYYFIYIYYIYVQAFIYLYTFVYLYIYI